jgi:16S rRNA (cytosine967-C5)-methyltransferase
VSTDDAYANLVLPAVVSRMRLDARDARLATELAYGTLRMRGTLDWVLSLHVDRPLADVEPSVLDVLRLGAYQLLYTDIPDHAAVGETAGLAGRRAVGFVNAVLRRIAGGRAAIPWPERDGDLATYLTLRYSHPEWIVRMWLAEMGAETTEALLAAGNEAPSTTIRVEEALHDEVRRHLQEAGLEVDQGRWSPRALRVRGGGRPDSWPGWSQGWFGVQDEASVLVADALAPAPGEVVVDLCAGPGGKTAALAAAGGRVVALEPHAGRAGLVAGTLGRMCAGGRVVVVRADGRHPPVRAGVDAVLVDAPCTGLGVLRRRPEARWRLREADVEQLADLQFELVRAGFDLLREGGRLVYAVCTVTSAETTGVLDRLLSAEPAAAAVEILPGVPRAAGVASGPGLQLLPHVHATDGMFVACVERRP